MVGGRVFDVALRLESRVVLMQMSVGRVNRAPARRARSDFGGARTGPRDLAPARRMIEELMIGLPRDEPHWRRPRCFSLCRRVTAHRQRGAAARRTPMMAGNRHAISQKPQDLSRRTARARARGDATAVSGDHPARAARRRARRRWRRRRSRRSSRRARRPSSPSWRRRGPTHTAIIGGAPCSAAGGSRLAVNYGGRARAPRRRRPAGRRDLAVGVVGGERRRRPVGGGVGAAGGGVGGGDGSAPARWRPSIRCTARRRRRSRWRARCRRCSSAWRSRCSSPRRAPPPARTNDELYADLKAAAGTAFKVPPAPRRRRPRPLDGGARAAGGGAAASAAPRLPARAARRGDLRRRRRARAVMVEVEAAGASLRRSVTPPCSLEPVAAPPLATAGAQRKVWSRRVDTEPLLASAYGRAASA